MIYLSFPIGILLPTLSGWLILGLLQRKKAVLYKSEQWILGCVVGLTSTMLITFALHAYAYLPLNLVGFSSVQLLLLVALFSAHVWLKPDRSGVAARTSPPLSTAQKILMIVLGLWIITRTLMAGVTFLMLVPTFLDDTLDNWNLRGKVYFEDQALTLVMPGEDPVLSPKGVSSYPPAVPLVKTWLSTIAGRWSEPLINSIHLIWYAAAVTLLYFILRRKTSIFWSLVGSYMLASLPLYFMHGTNPYADAFMSVHVLLTLAPIYLGLTTNDSAERTSFLSIGAFMAGLLAGFTKNEGLLIYLPPMLLMLVLVLFLRWRSSNMNMKEVGSILIRYAVWIALLALPWLIFKWTRGLTFGNAKPFTSFNLYWHDNVLRAIGINTFLEGNWHLLFPLLFGLLVWRWKRAFNTLAILSSFFLIVYVGQMLIFIFTDLANEALMQTGYARGLIHLAPVISLLTTLLLAPDQREPLSHTAA